jgi:hypothetical protein
VQEPRLSYALPHLANADGYSSEREEVFQKQLARTSRHEAMLQHCFLFVFSFFFFFFLQPFLRARIRRLSFQTRVGVPTECKPCDGPRFGPCLVRSGWTGPDWTVDGWMMPSPWLCRLEMIAPHHQPPKHGHNAEPWPCTKTCQGQLRTTTRATRYDGSSSGLHIHIPIEPPLRWQISINHQLRPQ